MVISPVYIITCQAIYNSVKNVLAHVFCDHVFAERLPALTSRVSWDIPSFLPVMSGYAVLVGDYTVLVNGYAAL